MSANIAALTPKALVEASAAHRAADTGIKAARHVLNDQLAQLADQFDELADQADLQSSECRAIAGRVRGACL